MNLVEDLRKEGLRAHIQPVSGRELIDGYLELDLDGRQVVYAIEQKPRAPYPNEVDRLTLQRNRLATVALPLFVAPFISASVGEALASNGWSWADEHGNYFLTAPGLRLRNRAVSEPRRRSGRQLPQGTGSGAIIRYLIREWRTTPLPGVSTLAKMVGVSQPRVSQVLGRLLELGFVSKVASGDRWVVDREALLDRFLDEYRGPGGSERHLYSLDPPLVSAQRAASTSRHGDLVVSADVGPDFLAPWRKPTVVVLYTRTGVVDSDVGAVRAESRESANVIVRVPRDLSVFPIHQSVAAFNGVDIPLADPVQMVWDLLELGGAEREEAAGAMRRWIVGQP